MKIPEFDRQDYNYELPTERIAEFPLEDRSSSKLLTIDKKTGTIKDYIFKDIVDLLDSGSSLLFNETKVIAARIKLNKESGGKAEILLLKPLLPSVDPAVTIASSKECTWECIIGGKRIKEGTVLILNENGLELKAEVLEKNGNKGTVKLMWNPDNLSFSKLLTKIANIPLPPYIKRDSIEKDKETYQTVYANIEGSVAAPTAGLHFTKEVLNQLDSKGVKRIELLLHVGAGTFLPLSDDDIKKHDMHAERIEVSKNSIKSIIESLENKKRIVCVGTTSIRTVESLCIFGELLANNNPDTFFVDQWDSYQHECEDPLKSLYRLLDFIDKNKLDQISGETKMIIVPGYKFRIVDSIITNFHQPDSTLLLLVGAFLGKENLKRVYDHALQNDYRFLSYGDSSLLS